MSGGCVRSAVPGSLFIAAAAVLWGTTGTAQAFAPEGASPAAVGAVRIALGGLALLAVAARRGELRFGRTWPLLVTGVAAVGIAGYQPLFFGGVSRTGVAVGTIAAIGSAPVWAGILGWVFRGERPGMRWVLATVLAVAGCALLVGAGAGIGVDPFGVLLALGAGLCYATFATASKNLLDSLPQAAVVAVTFSLGAVLLSPVLLFTDTTWLAEPRGLGVALELGLLATAVAYLLFAHGLRRVPVANAATLSLAEPLTAGLLGVVVLGEWLEPAGVAGAGLLMLGLVLVSVRGKAPGSGR